MIRTSQIIKFDDVQNGANIGVHKDKYAKHLSDPKS